MNGMDLRHIGTWGNPAPVSSYKSTRLGPVPACCIRELVELVAFDG